MDCKHHKIKKNLNKSQWNKRIKWQTFSTKHSHWKTRNEADEKFDPSDHFQVVSEFVLTGDGSKIDKEIRFVNQSDLSWIQPVLAPRQQPIQASEHQMKHRLNPMFVSMSNQFNH